MPEPEATTAHDARQDAIAYADRPYERKLSDNGRKIVSLDLDADLVDEVDRIRSSNRLRRGLTIDALLRIALSSPEASAMA
jgi:hypothetical protein